MRKLKRRKTTSERHTKSVCCNGGYNNNVECNFQNQIEVFYISIMTCDFKSTDFNPWLITIIKLNKLKTLFYIKFSSRLSLRSGRLFLK